MHVPVHVYMYTSCTCTSYVLLCVCFLRGDCCHHHCDSCGPGHCHFCPGRDYLVEAKRGLFEGSLSLASLSSIPPLPLSVCSLPSPYPFTLPHSLPLSHLHVHVHVSPQIHDWLTADELELMVKEEDDKPTIKMLMKGIHVCVCAWCLMCTCA